ncbi:MAG: flagellar type III secretion system pore protein FliP [Lachnospiraceae bacterium]|nr:flagellar type III secretion system pore protein FliP [Ruminococcus sp.]MCM1273848.1 flagellar type III secretion system pore protein FliP [Lachnospiraceae bacterium]
MIKRLLETDKKLVLKFAVSLFLTILFAFVFVGATSYAASNDTSTSSDAAEGASADVTGDPNNSQSTAQSGDYTGAPSESVGRDPGSSVLQEVIGVDASQPLEIIILLTLIALLPSLLIMVTCFARIVIVLGFLRSAMQTQNTPPNMVLTGLALFLTIFIMAPVIGEINEVAYQPYANEQIDTKEALERAAVPLKRFMLKQTTNDDLEFFIGLAKEEVPEGGMTDEYKENDLSLTVIIPSFMIGELKRAFQMGFMIFLPFLIIDIVVGSTLMSMGMMMLPPAMISMPFKILIFVLADGWNLMIGSIVTSYNL